jgi:hypothetical protein
MDLVVFGTVAFEVDPERKLRLATGAAVVRIVMEMVRTSLVIALTMTAGCREQPTPSATSGTPAPSATDAAVPLGAASEADSGGLGTLGSSRCAIRDDAVWRLRLVLQPSHRARLLARAGAIPGRLACEKGGAVYLELTTSEARRLFGSHVTFSSIRGAGNATDSCGSFVRIEPDLFVPATLADDVRSAAFDTDEKFELLHDLRPCP